MITFSSIIQESAGHIPSVWYHATTKETAERIMRDGFKPNNNEIGFYGEGVYFANPIHTFDKARYVISIDSSSLNILYRDLKTDDDVMEFDKYLLQAPSSKKAIEDYKKKYNRDNSWYVPYEKYKEVMHDDLGYDAYALHKDEERFFTGYWLIVYDMDKLNALPRTLKQLKMKEQKSIMNTNRGI